MIGGKYLKKILDALSALPSDKEVFSLSPEIQAVIGKLIKGESPASFKDFSDEVIVQTMCVIINIMTREKTFKPAIQLRDEVEDFLTLCSVFEDTASKKDVDLFVEVIF